MIPLAGRCAVRPRRLGAELPLSRHSAGSVDISLSAICHRCKSRIENESWDGENVDPEKSRRRDDGRVRRLCSGARGGGNGDRQGRSRRDLCRLHRRLCVFGRAGTDRLHADRRRVLYPRDRALDRSRRRVQPGADGRVRVRAGSVRPCGPPNRGQPRIVRDHQRNGRVDRLLVRGDAARQQRIRIRDRAECAAGGSVFRCEPRAEGRCRGRRGLYADTGRRAVLPRTGQRTGRLRRRGARDDARAQQSGRPVFRPVFGCAAGVSALARDRAGRRFLGPALINDPLSKPGARGHALFFNDYNTVRLGEKVGWYDRTDPFSIDFWIYPDTVYADAMLFTHSEEWRLGLRGYTMQLENNAVVFRMAHSYPQNAIRVATSEQVPVRKWTHLTLTYDGSSRAEGVALYLDGEPADLQVTVDNLYKGILFTPDIHTYGFKGIELGHRGKFTPFKHGGIDEFSVFNAELSPLEVRYLHDQAGTAYRRLPEEESDTPDVREMLSTHFFLRHARESIRLRAQLKKERTVLNDLLNTIPEIMVMGDLPEPRRTYVLDRGLYNAPREEVSPDTPVSVMAFPSDLPANRLGLAKWLFHPNHPLTSRVAVNRIWSMHFGRGLVPTADDFGNQGTLAEHEGLLDWLAIQFQASGWDLKALHKSIMLSATYQQSSMITESLLERDPDNRLLARGPSFRLSAEMIRDNALAVSGLLSRRMGGPSAYPYQPAGLWDELSTKSWRYPYLQEPGEGLYRRSLYTVWKRTAPPPAMLIFDAPDRSTCTVERQNTSTPLQALALLNDPQHIEAARALAEDLLENESDTAMVLTQLFRRVTSRPPSSKEFELLERFFKDELETFKDNPEQAIAYLQTGASTRNVHLDPIKTAALAVMANALMNSDEGYMRR